MAVDRQIGVKKFIRVVILDPPTNGHVTQRMRNPKIAIQAYDIAGISETITDRQEISGQYSDNENVSGDAVLWRHNKSKMADGRHFKDR